MRQVLPVLLIAWLWGCSSAHMVHDERPRQYSDEEIARMKVGLEDVGKVLRMGMTLDETLAALDVERNELHHRWTWGSSITYSCDSKRFPDTPLRLTFRLAGDTFRSTVIAGLEKWELEDL
jgi:hypothetical protein